ncbi:MAG: isoprenyl transferase [bacterium]|nr:isoprenyl transferase [bacterium]
MNRSRSGQTGPKEGNPRHIAIIMDGNGRWAKKRGLPRVMGHHEGIRSVRAVVEACGELGIEVLTLYTFSTENWRRPADEVSALMKLLLKTIQKEIADLVKNNVRLTVIGDFGRLPEGAAQGMEKAIEATRSNTGLNLNLALNYGGREELVRAVRSIAVRVREGLLDPETITGGTVQDHLYTAGMPDPDLLIRTSGELRISNFLLWQLAYTEIYVTDVLWPDFRKADLLEAIESYRNRERRFGKVSEQLSRPTGRS